MLVFALVLFAGSLLATILLFAMKSREAKRGITAFEKARAAADARALELKDFMGRSRFEFAKLIPALILIIRYGVHELALLLAALGRLVERQAHRLADSASHKHRFERRESRSEFLKKIGDHKSDRVE